MSHKHSRKRKDRSIKEIMNQQKRTDLLIRKLPFTRLVREVLRRVAHSVRSVTVITVVSVVM